MVAGIAAGLTAKYIFSDSEFVHTYIIEGLFFVVGRQEDKWSRFLGGARSI